MDFVKLLRTPFLTEHLRWLLLLFLSVSLLLPIRFTLRCLPSPLLYSEVLFLFLILYLGTLFYKEKKKKRKEKKKIFTENHTKILEIVVLTDRCIIKKMITKKM